MGRPDSRCCWACRWSWPVRWFCSPRALVWGRRATKWPGGADADGPGAGGGQFISFIGLFVVKPNEARVLQLFGNYVGTANGPGCSGPTRSTRKKRISLRVRNFESAQLKVNDTDGNPIEIARDRGLAGGRHRRGGLRRRRLRELRARAERVGAAQPGHQLSLRLARRRARGLAARQHARRSPSI